jgi:hypothetical protein
MGLLTEKKRRFGFASGILLLLITSMGLLPCRADQFIKNPKHSIDARLKTDVWGSKATEGQIFEAELGDALHYKTWSLPAGTVFRGQVSKVRESRHLGRPGYVVLTVDEAQLPGGERFAFNHQQYKPRNAKIHNKDSLTIKQNILQQMPSTALGLGLTLPLSITGAASGLAMTPAGLGVRMLTGSACALSEKSKYKNQPTPRRVAYGALDGSGVIRMLGFLGKYPEPEYKAGDSIKLHFNPHGLKAMFVAFAKNNQGKAVPLEPSGPMVEPPAQQPNNLVKTPSKEPQTATFP